MFSELTTFAVAQGPVKKPQFQYVLPLVGDVCRKCWILCAGYSNENNGRVRSIEAKIRQGHKGHAIKLPRRRKRVNMSSYARAFMRDYISRFSQSSPADTILYVDFCGLQELHARYLKEMKGQKSMTYGSFKKLWNEVLSLGYTDPETSVQFTVRIRQSRAKGFAKCNKCQCLKMRISGRLPNNSNTVCILTHTCTCAQALPTLQNARH